MDQMLQDAHRFPEPIRMQSLNKQYFMKLMADRRMSMRGLAQKMGMLHSQLSLTFSGQRKLQLDEAAKLSQIFGVPFHQIAANAGVEVRPTSGRRVSVIGFVGADGLVSMNQPGVIERTDAPDDLPDDTVAIQCRTADTPLSWMDGWVLFFRSQSGIDAGAITGRFCIAQIKGGPVVIATAKRGYRDGTYNLSGPHARQDAVLEWASPLLVGRF